MLQFEYAQNDQLGANACTTKKHMRHYVVMEIEKKVPNG